MKNNNKNNNSKNHKNKNNMITSKAWYAYSKVQSCECKWEKDEALMANVLCRW